MKLNVLERLILLNILPREGNFTNLKILRVAKEALSFTEEENKVLKFRQQDSPDGTKGGAMMWEGEAVGEKEIVLGEVVTQLIAKELKRLDGEEKLTDEHFSVYEKFIK